MKNRLIYSTTIRCLEDKNSLIGFKKSLKTIEKSKFSHANFNFCEIPQVLDEDNYKEIFNEVIEDSKLTFNIAHAPIHFPFFFNDYYNMDKKDLYEQRIMRALEISAIIGVKSIVIHIGTTLDNEGKYDFKASVKENIKYLNKFVEFAVKNNIMVAIENGTNMEKEVTPTIDELIQIVDYYNKLYKKEVLGICFDFGHANVAKINMYEAIKKIGHRLKVTHIHDNYGTDTHNFPFDGDINWNILNNALNQINYTEELTLEVRYKDDKFNEDTINETYDLLEKIENCQ